jgi:anaerobic selenocysteine-containing dehydrogenase
MIKLIDRTGKLTQELALTPETRGLGALPVLQAPSSTVNSVCGYCSTGCGLQVHIRDGEAVNLAPRADYPVNSGMACPKGWEALTVLKANDRGTIPLARDRHSQETRGLPWTEAAELFCSRMKLIQESHGSDSIAFISTGQIPTEEMAFLGTLAKFGMGIRHGDGNTRQCMATSVVAYKESFGFDAPPFTYDDFEQSDALFFFGANPCLAHPILWQRVLRNRRNPKIVVVDPRRTETAMSATEHLAIAPKSDMALLYGLAAAIIQRGAVDHEFVSAHTNGFETFAEFVKDYTLDKTAQLTGCTVDQLDRVVDIIIQSPKTSFWWTMGVNQSYQGVRTAQGIINLALMTGNIGKPGTGANSITGQCNAMGSRLFSNTTNLFGHHDYTNPEHREKIARILEIPLERIPTTPCWAYDQIIDGIESGSIKALWIIATNTSHSWINSPRARDLLSKLEFLVVQDMYYSTDTAKQADLYFPAAGWGEKEGTFINSERRIGTIKKVAKAPGQALSDFSIFRLLAETWGCGDWFAKWKKPEDVFRSMQEVSRGMPNDITGIQGYQQLDRVGGIQWPWAELQQADDPQGSSNQRRLFEDGRFYHADGKAKFVFEEPRPMPEMVSVDFPLMLLTGRGSASQWHTETRTSKSAVLRRLYPAEPFVEIHPADAASLGIEDQAWVVVESLRGSATVKAQITSTVQLGQVYMPMHDQQTNFLTLQHVDPYSRQPSYKNAAVRIRLVTSRTVSNS